MSAATIEFFDMKKPPPLAYTEKEAIRLVDANRDARKGWEKAFRPCWWPDVSWRMTGGGCYSPNTKDTSYIRGQFRFVYPHNQPQLRRKMARKNGRRTAVRVPLMDWFWWVPEMPQRGGGMYEFKPYIRASELPRAGGLSKRAVTMEAHR